MNARPETVIDWNAVKRDLVRAMTKIGEPISGRQWTKLRKTLQRTHRHDDSRGVHEELGMALGPDLPDGGR